MIINTFKSKKGFWVVLLILAIACSKKGFGQTGELFYNAGRAFIDDKMYAEGLKYLDSAIYLNYKND